MVDADENASQMTKTESDESLHGIIASVSGDTKKIVTQWKGQIVPMNDHSDKEAVVYVDPLTERSYRFILHRKNHQKADNYACARCKSRKKYVRILIAGEYFMEDPAGLEHICYMTPEELKEARERNREVVKFGHRRSRQSAGFEFSADNFPAVTFAKLFEHQHEEPFESTNLLHSPSGMEEQLGTTDSVSASILDNFLKFIPPQKIEPMDDPAPKLFRRDESDPEPQEPTPQPPTTEQDVFFISLRRALEGLPSEHRAKAENDVLRYVYNNLYTKYAANE